MGEGGSCGFYLPALVLLFLLVVVVVMVLLSMFRQKILCRQQRHLLC